MLPPPSIRPHSAGVNLPPNFRKRGLTESPFLEGGCWEREEVTFFKEDLPFLNKIKKLNLKYLMTKKVCEQKCFSLPKLRISTKKFKQKYVFVNQTNQYIYIYIHICNIYIYIHIYNNKQFCISYVFQSYLADFVNLDLIFKS